MVQARTDARLGLASSLRRAQRVRDDLDGHGHAVPAALVHDSEAPLAQLVACAHGLLVALAKNAPLDSVAGALVVSSRAALKP